MSSPPAALDLLGYAVALTAEDPGLADYLRRLYAAFPPVEHTDHTLAVEGGGGGRVVVRGDGHVLLEADRPEAVVGALVSHLNRAVAEASTHVLVHAGGVARDGVAVMLPAAMEAGKTTLTAGLVRAGFGYLSDEAIALDRTTGTVVPYPKPLSLDPGSWPLFPELEPHEPFGTDRYKHVQWQVPPGAFRADALGRAGPVRFVVFPTYEQGRATRLEPLSRAEALVELTKHTFRFDREGRPTLDVLADVVRHADVYRLPNGDLAEAVACITDLFARS